ncbi:MAG: transaldolase [Acidobacteria bacterium]|nr:transaldolase [Acidobacteriota bacterium]MCA1612200.1 transaldolase [Acidobacteriota bacterium]
MTGNPLQRLNALGQSIWYDYIRRDLFTSGRLDRMIREDALTGMTSNPTIFQKAIADSDLYDEDMRRLAGQGLDTYRVFEGLEVQDVQRAADLFRPVFDRTGGDDGFVSIEVGPHLALDRDGTIEEARRLWKSCDRPNVMVKIPGTKEGVPAIRQCLEEGININITLLFSVSRYREVMEAYLAGLEARAAAGKPVDRVRSVASFFVSRVDTMADKKLDARAKEAGSDRERALAKDLRSKVGIANARIAFQAFEEIFGGGRFEALAKKGVKRQKPLWASTSTKDPALPDLYYVEALVAPDTVDTMPPETLEAYRDHGEPAVRIHDDLQDAHAVFRGLTELGIDDKAIFRDLEDEGIRKFSDSYDSLMKTLAEKQQAVGAR